MSFGATKKVFASCQFEKMLIQLRRGLVPWLCGILEKHPYGKQKNRGSQVVA